MNDKITIDIADLRKDQSSGSAYYSWQSNIAMAFYDEMDGYGIVPTETLHKIANDAAKRFLNRLINE